jgi:hypothetical protein
MFVWMIEPARAFGQTNWRMASVLQDFGVEPLRLHWDKKALVLQNTVPYGVLSAAWLDGTGLFNRAVPEPGRMMLFGSGVIGLAGLLRRKLSL